MVPVDDTALAVTDTGRPGRPVVYLNGSYADQSHWRRVIAELGSDYRHITYDERARGKSKRSADYSFEASVRDVDAVLARGGSTGRCSSAGPTARRSGCTGPTGIRIAPWEWCAWTALFRSALPARMLVTGSAACSAGCACCCRSCARSAWLRG